MATSIFFLANAFDGNKLTLSAGNYAPAATSGFNPGTTQVSSGDMYVASRNAIRISDIVPAGVPEPSTWALLGIGAVSLGSLALRRRLLV